MTANKPETALYRPPTFSLLLVSHGGISSWGHRMDLLHARAKEFDYVVTSKCHIRLLSGHHEVYCSKRRNICVCTSSAPSVRSVPSGQYRIYIFYLIKSTLQNAAVFARENGVRGVRIRRSITIDIIPYSTIRYNIYGITENWAREHE